MTEARDEAIIVCHPVLPGQKAKFHDAYRRDNPWAMIEKCRDCGCEVWRDTRFTPQHPETGTPFPPEKLVTLCLGCGASRLDSGEAEIPDEFTAKPELIADYIGGTIDDAATHIDKLRRDLRTRTAIAKARREFEGTAGTGDFS